MIQRILVLFEKLPGEWLEPTDRLIWTRTLRSAAELEINTSRKRAFTLPTSIQNLSGLLSNIAELAAMIVRHCAEQLISLTSLIAVFICFDMISSTPFNFLCIKPDKISD